MGFMIAIKYTKRREITVQKDRAIPGVQTIRDMYESKKTSAKDIADAVQSGWNCYTDISCAIPPAIMDALGARAAAGELQGVRWNAMLDLFPIKALSTEAAGGITPVTWFSGKGLRNAANEGRGDIMPCYYRDVPGLMRQTQQVDAVFACVSPMDRHGYFSTGCSASYSEAILEKAGRIYLEVNECMPRALGGPQIHISQVTALCENTCPLPELPAAVMDPVSEAIGGFIAEEIPDGATLQLGIGAVPEAVGGALKGKRDLGIHTELLTDSMVALVECGAVTNERKPIHRGKTVATLAFGSKRIYEYIDDNPAVQMLPVDYVNDPAVIAQHPDFISVNAALEVDFFGQACAESMGTRHVSGSGGQADYVRGAVLSPGGKSFIAFPSTAKGGTISRITPTLSRGAIVTTGKNDIDHVVTEYGIAHLRGRTLSQRVRALIAIAHPKFREELTFEAKKRNILI